MNHDGHTTALLWRCELSTSTLMRLKQALQIYHIHFADSPAETFTVKLFTQATASDEGKDNDKEEANDTTKTLAILIANASSEPEKCIIQDYSAQRKGHFVATVDMEGLLTRLHGGVLKLRQTVAFNVPIPRLRLDIVAFSNR